MELTRTAPVELMAYSVGNFCRACSLSRSYFYELLKAGRGPRTFKLGKKTMISADAARAWLAKQEGVR